MFTPAHMIATVSRTPRCSEAAILGLGWTQGEIDAMVASGQIRRIGSQMGLATVRYLSVRA